MIEYDSPEMGEKAEIKESLRVLSLRRLGYDFADDQLLLEGEKIDHEALSGYKTGLHELPTISDVDQIEGAMIGVLGHAFVAQSMLEKADELIQHDRERLETIAKSVATVMRKSFDRVHPGLLEDVDVSENMLWGFQVYVQDDGMPAFNTFGVRAQLVHDPDRSMSTNSPTKELSFINIESRTNERLGRAQLSSLFAGLAAYSELIKVER